MTSCLNVSKNEAAKVMWAEKKVQAKCKIWVHTAVTGKDFDKDYSPTLHCWRKKSKSREMKGKLPAYCLHPEDSLTKLAKLAHVNPHTPAERHTLDTYIFSFPLFDKGIFSSLTLFPTNSTSFSSPSMSLRAPLLSAGKWKKTN